MIIDTDDIHSAALCSWKEARGEGGDGMLAVLCVLKNRVGYTGFASTLHEVIYGKNQFTSMSVPSDAEFNLGPAADDKLFPQALDLAHAVFDNFVANQDEPNQIPPPGPADITEGAHYYANLHTMQQNGWFSRNIVLNPDHPVTAQIGKHTFFK